MEVRGRLVLVTGASRGLGVRIAELFVAEGAQVLISARSAQELDAVRARLTCEALAGDVTSAADRAALVARADALGGCDILINNAGLESFAHYEALEPDAIDRVIDVNIRAPMQLTRAVLPGMMARKRGHIVNLASLAGLSGSACAEAYCASKHAMVGFTRALRASMKEQGTGVSASAVCPGFVADAGMYAVMNAATGATAPAFLGTTTPDAVAIACLRAVQRDLADIVVNPMPVRPALALQSMFPRIYERFASMIGGNQTFLAAAGKKL